MKIPYAFVYLSTSVWACIYMYIHAKEVGKQRERWRESEGGRDGGKRAWNLLCELQVKS